MKYFLQYFFIILLGFFTISLSLPTAKKLPENEIALGKLLFFDPILSLDKTISCASCHKPQFAFADSVAFSRGIKGGITKRNTPSAMNVALRPYLFWDGRSPSLENQALQPISNPLEMGLPITEAIKRLNRNKFYVKAFQKIYGKKPNAALLGNAIGAFESTLETGDSPFDIFMRGDSSKITLSAIRGRIVFVERAHCFDCHFSPDFTGDEFKNIGLFDGSYLTDSGRFFVTGNTEDIGLFRVPGLRNIALTAPYMHNGMFKTLEEVVDYYDNPNLFVPKAIGRDSILNNPLHLTAQEKLDLVAFLRSLTSEKLLKE